MFRSNLKIGSTRLLSQLTGAPSPKLPAPQRSYAQMCPSFGSISMPAVDPHSLPEGNSPQLAITVGAGFGRPSPVIGLPHGHGCRGPRLGAPGQHKGSAGDQHGHENS